MFTITKRTHDIINLDYLKQIHTYIENYITLITPKAIIIKLEALKIIIVDGFSTNFLRNNRHLGSSFIFYMHIKLLN